MSERFVPLEAGKVIRVADMAGRLRAYDLHMADGARHTAVGIAVSRRCDLLVAVAQGAGAAPDVQRAALDFLASGEMTRWMTAAMDGGQWQRDASVGGVLPRRDADPLVGEDWREG